MRTNLRTNDQDVGPDYSKPASELDFLMDLLGRYSKRTSWAKRLQGLPWATTRDQPGGVRHRRVAVPTLPATKVTELVDDYRTGASINDLSARFGIHRTTVTHHLHRNGVTLRHCGLDDHQVDHAIRLYQQGHRSLARVGARFNVHAETIRQALRTRGIQMRAAWERG